MEVAAIILAALVVVGAILWLLDRRNPARKSDTEEAVSAPAADAETDTGEVCCGQHYSCERDSLLTALSKDIVYYEDEELDRFAGRPADGYTEDEKDEFRDIFLTLLPDDLAGWGRSIQLRGINLPDDVRDEFIMLIDEHRRGHTVGGRQTLTNE